MMILVIINIITTMVMINTILVIVILVIIISITMMTCAMELSGASEPAARDHHLQTSLAHTMTCNIKHSNISNIVRCAMPSA